MTDGSGSAAWAYDIMGRVTSEIKTIAGTTAFTTQSTYDALSRVRALTYPDGEVVATAYNLQGLISSLTIPLANYVSGTTFNAAGMPLAVSFGNGMTTNYTYNAQNLRLLTLQTGSLRNFAYSYDNLGNIKTITDTTNSGQVLSFGYDALNRLTSASTSTTGQGQ